MPLKYDESVAILPSKRVCNLHMRYLYCCIAQYHGRGENLGSERREDSNCRALLYTPRTGEYC